MIAPSPFCSIRAPRRALAILAFVILIVSLPSGCRHSPPPESPPLFKLKVGVIENRKPSLNSHVWVIPTDQVSELAALFKSRQVEVAEEADSFRFIMDFVDEAERDLEKCEYHDGEDKFIVIYKKYAKGKTEARLLQLKGDLRKLEGRMLQSHLTFLKNLSSQLESIAISGKSSGIEGVATFDDLAVPDVSVFLIPAAPDRFGYASKRIDLRRERELFVEFEPVSFTLTDR